MAHIQAYVPEELKERVDKLAEEQERSVSFLVAKALEETYPKPKNGRRKKSGK